MSKMCGRLRQPEREQPTLKSHEKVSERCEPGEEIQGLGPVPSGTPNVLDLMRQCQQPIVDLWTVIVYR